ncbi:Kelch domain-containing protein 1 [Bagarius yarrelli]|uniref:Kelch domain-containing protein 1 n=1 Tax=Bagarius yarrelli TaxID=175774 RepID=A0A556TIP7_BAGYA|nr:Kelch domain-containing protein 1 [Bagarius yarrelli]
MEIVTELPEPESRRMAAPARSDHVALLLGNVLHVWGGLQYVDGEEVLLPSDEIWLYDMESGGMGGEFPPRLSQTCGSLLNGMLYVFGGRDSDEYTDQMYCVDLQDENYTWRKLNTCDGTPPSPRDRHSCWVYKNRLFYFGGYGWKTVRDINNHKTFTVDETSWVTNGRVYFRYWGWNSEVHIFEPDSATWTKPQCQGIPPEPRAAHASATLGSKGYICGGLEPAFVYVPREPLASPVPIGRALHTLTPTSPNTLFLFGGLSMSGQVLCDGWEFNTMKKEWRERLHSYKHIPRLWHSAVQGKDNDVVVFGGSRDYVLVMDMVTVLRVPSQSHCGDVLVFQSQPYSLTRLCEDCIGKHGSVLREKVSSLPPRLQETLYKRMSYFKMEMQKPTDYT